MNWKTKTTNDKTTTASGDFNVIHCSNGKFQLRRAGAMLGTFPTLAAAKAKAASVAPPEAPAPAEANAAKAGRPTGVKHNKLLGFSACAVAKALGRVGVKFDEADRILKSHGVTMPKASLSVQLGFGRNPNSWERHGKPASLTDEQLADLRTAAPL
jgi:hypothetical protein